MIAGEPAAQSQATETIARRMGYDIAGGGPGPDKIEAQLGLTPGGVGQLAPSTAATPSPPGVPGVATTQLVPGTRPLTIADVAGANVGPRGLAGVVARASGPGQQTAEDFLNARDAGAPGRLLDDVRDLIDTGQQPAGQTSLTTLVDRMKERSQQAQQLYDQANWAVPRAQALPACRGRSSIPMSPRWLATRRCCATRWIASATMCPATAI